MLKLGKMTDYAVVCLGILSKNRNHFITATKISEISGLRLSTVQRILKVLVSKSNFILTHRGSNGGYKIKIPARQIYIIEVIEALEGPINITACVQGGSQICESSKKCLLEGNWNNFNELIRNSIKNYSLADLLAPDNFFNIYNNEQEVNNNLVI